MTRTVTLAGYAVIASAMGIVQVVGLLSARVPTIGTVIRLVTRRAAGRWVLVAGWLWLGWHLFVRASRG